MHAVAQLLVLFGHLEYNLETASITESILKPQLHWYHKPPESHPDDKSLEGVGIYMDNQKMKFKFAASNYLKGITDGGAKITTKLQQFSDFQQGAVQELILPFGKRLNDADNRMKELPYTLYDSQDILVCDIDSGGSGGIKQGLALLSGIQINTSPDTLDYFHPLRFDYYDADGEVIEDLLPGLVVSKPV